MSTYISDSEISRFNSHRSLEPVDVSDGFEEVLSLALAISSRSQGAFDVTVGPLVNLWGFGPEDAPEAVDEAVLEETLSRVGFAHLALSNGAVAKSNPALEVDFSAIAKGWGVDQLADLLVEKNHQDFLVEIGGEVRASGLNPENQPWRLGIEKPLIGEREVHHVVELKNQAMATSGDYRNFVGEGAQRRSHSIDPRTGRPVAHSLASVSVVAADCASADAWATALTVLGPEEGFEIAEKEGIVAFFLVRENDGSFSEKTTAAFGRLSAP